MASDGTGVGGGNGERPPFGLPPEFRDEAKPPTAPLEREGNTKNVSPESQGQNLAVTVLYLPYLPERCSPET